jgi:hypothetical protein
MVRPTPGAVRRDFGEANDPQVLAGAVKNPNAFRAGAIHPPFNIHFHAVGNAVRRRCHVCKNAVVAQAAVNRHVESADALVGANLAACFFLKAPFISPGDGHVENAFVRGEGNAVGVLGFGGGVGQGTIGGDTVHAAEVELPLLRGQPSTWVGEVDAPVRASH